MAWPTRAWALAAVLFTPTAVRAASVHDLKHPMVPDAAQAYTAFERRYDLKVGDKGEDTFDVDSEQPACGEFAWVFDHARLVHLERRFADAQIVALPEAGCFDCAPLAVRWYHEPTGRLSYRLHIHRRLVAGSCPARLP